MRWEPDTDLDFAASTDRYTRWGDDPVNVVRDGWFHRAVRVDGELVLYRATQLGDGSLEVEPMLGDGTLALADLQTRLAEQLPVEPLLELATQNERVATLVERFKGFRPPITPDPFESIVGSICAQQVNLRWARTTRARLVERFGRRHEIRGADVWEFPTPASMAGATVDEIRRMQFTTRKAEYLVGVAQVAADGGFRGLEHESDAAVIEQLTEIRGIGRWTAEWLLARCFARPHVIAAGDLGVRKAVSFNYLAADDILSPDVVRDTASAWGDATNWTTHLLLETLT